MLYNPLINIIMSSIKHALVEVNLALPETLPEQCLNRNSSYPGVALRTHGHDYHDIRAADGRRC